MRIDEITLGMVKQHAKIEHDEDDGIIEKIYMPAALAHLAGYTGLDKAALMSSDDLAVAYLVLCEHLYDNRGYIVENDKINRVIDALIGKYSSNLV